MMTSFVTENIAMIVLCVSQTVQEVIDILITGHDFIPRLILDKPDKLIRFLACGDTVWRPATAIQKEHTE